MKTTIPLLYPALKAATRKLAAFAALTLICVTASASPPGTGGGTIYYVHSGAKTTRTMNSDGTNQTQLGFGTYGPVSTLTYNGHRWFLDTRAHLQPSRVLSERRSPEPKSTRSATTSTTTPITTAPQASGLPTISRFKPTGTEPSRCTGFPAAR